MINKVQIDTTHYPGEDLYSDGIIEDKILKLVQDNPVTDYNRVIAAEKDWAILYHLSEIRENIVEWLPITKEDSVLEIGAGCGAITGALCRKAKEVECIDLSKKRSMINATRNGAADNLTIKLGNFQDIAKNTTKKYDWITLTGVFEYGRYYIDSDNPYVDFLKMVKAMLSERGHLVIAIENKLGLKYFAGCTEDHSGKFFDGIEGYRKGGHAETFSKKELQGMLKTGGFGHTEFYYPYPDYKLPLTIYSDEYLPKIGELANNRNNFDRRRLQVFDEDKAFDSVTEAGLFGELSNSFLIIAAASETSNAEQTIFSKYANERSDRFTLRTDIVRQEDDSFVVRKKALGQEAFSHVNSICEIGELLNEQYADSRFEFNKCTKIKEGVELEFIAKTTLAEEADKLLYLGKNKETEDLIFEVIDEIYKVKEQREFRLTTEFVEVFGEALLAKGLVCAKISDIDMLLGNIMQGEVWTVIDYEWSFNFPIPLKFIVYRLLHYYLQGNQSRSILDKEQMFKRAKISDSELVSFDKMERHFQDVYVLANKDTSHHTPIRDMYDDIADGLVDVRTLYETVSNMAVTPEEHRDPLRTLMNRAKLYGEKEELKAKLAQSEEKVVAMENTKIWKAYRKYRNLKDKQ